MKHTAEEVRETARILNGDVSLSSLLMVIPKAVRMLTAYADMIELAQAGVTDFVRDCAITAYNLCPGPGEPLHVEMHGESMRAALLAVWPVAAERIETGESVVPLGYLSPQGDRFIPISRWEASMSLGHWTKVFAHPPAQADARTVRPSRVGGRHFAVGSLVQEVIDRAYACYDRYYDAPTAEPVVQGEAVAQRIHQRLAWLERGQQIDIAEFCADVRELAAQPRAVSDVVTEVLAELERATRKFPTWPTDPLHAIAVLNEEVGELNKAVLQQVYEPHKNSPGAVRSEALQAAAMTLRFIASLDRYTFDESTQHDQVVLPPTEVLHD